VGPGALISDAHMMGIEPVTQRPYMNAALDAIMALFAMDGPVSMETEWFTLRDARLQIAPYTDPHPEVAVASTLSPAGPVSAGKHGVGILSSPQGIGDPQALARSWSWAEEAAAASGRTMDRARWRIVVPLYMAESRAEAMADIRVGCEQFFEQYFGATLGNPLPECRLETLIDAGLVFVGTPDDVVTMVERLLEQTGGFGGLLLRPHEWTTDASKLQRSYELFARYVMPRFRSQIDSLLASQDWVAGMRETFYQPAKARSIEQAFRDAGVPVPDWVRRRLQAEQSQVP
jgi:limonene 1,2-monooxygenase